MKKFGYSKEDVESTIVKWAKGLLAHVPYVRVTPSEALAIQKKGICISLDRGMLVRHSYLERGV